MVFLFNPFTFFNQVRNVLYCFCTILACFFNSLPNVEYSNLLIVTACSSKSFPGETTLAAINSYLPTLPDDKAEILPLKKLVDDSVVVDDHCRSLVEFQVENLVNQF